MAAFTGMGFDSAKFASIRGRSRAWTSRAAVKSSVRRLHELGHLARHLVRGHRDDAAGAHRHRGEGEGVVAREHEKAFGDAPHHLADLVMLRRPP